MNVLTEPYGYGPLARRVAVLGLICLFAILQLVRAYLYGRISGFYPEGDKTDTAWFWRRWQRGVDGGFWGAVSTYALAAIACVSVAIGLLPDFRLSPQPRDLNALGIKPTEILLNWNSPERGSEPSTYLLYRDVQPLPNPPPESAYLNRCGSETYRDDTVESGTRYYYRVAAEYRWENLAFSNEATAVTP